MTFPVFGGSFLLKDIFIKFEFSDTLHIRVTGPPPGSSVLAIFVSLKCTLYSNFSPRHHFAEILNRIDTVTDTSLNYM